VSASGFYAEQWSDNLRLGDIVTGYVLADPNHIEPIKNSFVDYRVDVKLPPLLAVLTPCCSIGAKTVLMAPLERVSRIIVVLFKNLNYRNDMTLLNLPHSPEEWKQLDEDVTPDPSGKLTYSQDNLFFYAPTEDETLKKYLVTLKKNGNEFEKFESGYYLIDFRQASKVNCNCIVHEKDKRTDYNEALIKARGTKILELSKKSRSELRDKLAFYYSRIPDVDLIE
jgi:hypothetical protein